MPRFEPMKFEQFESEVKLDMQTHTATLQPLAGTMVYSCIVEAIEFSRRFDKVTVNFDFNGTSVSLNYRSNADGVWNEWHTRREMRANKI